jgi:ATP-dependent helicase/nuclease subunit A
VALTRARDRLVLCGRIDARTKDENVGGWYAAAQAAFAHADIAPGVREIRSRRPQALRARPDAGRGPGPARRRRRSRRPPGPWPRPRPRPPAARYAAPSTLEDEARGSAPSPLAARCRAWAAIGAARSSTGCCSSCPTSSPGRTPRAAGRLLAAERDLTDDQRDEMAAAAFGVLEDDRFAAVFGPGSRAEVSVAGGAAAAEGLAIAGRVDRLVVTPDRVLVVDYKTNRPSPDRIEDADPAYLAQMAVYAAVLAEVFPDRPIEAAIVWTDGPKLMAVPEKVMAAALARLF